MPVSGNSSDKIVSLLGDDPEMADLVEEFVSAMSERITAIEEALQSEDRDSLRRHMHQLKGACGGYGFPQLTDETGLLERRLQQGETLASLKSSIETIVDKLQRLSVAE